MLLLWVATGMLLLNGFSLIFLSICFFMAPFFVMVTTWTLRNWEKADYMLCFKGKTLVARSGGGAFSSPMTDSSRNKAALAGWYRDLRAKVLERAPTLIGLLFVTIGFPFVLALLLRDYTSNQLFGVWLSWSIPAIFMIVLCTTMLLKVYFRTFTVPPFICIMLLFWIGILCYNLGLGNPATCYKIEDVRNNLGNYLYRKKSTVPCEMNISFGEGIINRICGYRNETSSGFQNITACSTLYDTADCREKTTFDARVIYKCVCKQEWTRRLYYGPNCEYEGDTYSFNVKLPLITGVLTLYLVIVLNVIGLYKWSLMSFSSDSLSTILGWVLISDVPLTAWCIYMLFGDGVHEALSNSYTEPELNFPKQYLRLSLVWCWIGIHTGFIIFFHFVTNGFQLDTAVIIWCLMGVAVGGTVWGSLLIQGNTTMEWVTIEISMFDSDEARIKLIQFLTGFPLGGALGFLIMGFLAIKYVKKKQKKLFQIFIYGCLKKFFLLVVLPLTSILFLKALPDSGKVSFLDLINIVVVVIIFYWASTQFSSFCTDRSNYHFPPDTLLPVHYVDPVTDKLLQDDASTKRLFYIGFLLIVNACLHATLENKQNDIIHEITFFLSVVFLLVFVLQRHFHTKIRFSKAWEQMRFQHCLLDRLRAQAIEHEMKDLGGSGNGAQISSLNNSLKSYDCTCRLMQTSYQVLSNLISSQQNHPWELSTPPTKFDTHQACLKVVGRVPAEMPPVWEYFMNKVEKIDLAGQLLEASDNVQVPSSGSNMKSTGIELRSLKKLIPMKADSDDSDSDSEDELDDHPELLVSNAGHSAVDGIYTYIGRKECQHSRDLSNQFPVYRLVSGELGMGCYITVKTIDDGLANDGHGGTLYWVIMHGDKVVYRTLHTGGTPLSRKLSNRRSTESTTLSDFGNGRRSIEETKHSRRAAADSAAFEDDNNGPLMPNQDAKWISMVEDAEPSPLVMSTVLNSWKKVYRAGKGILNFQSAMNRLLKEEKRLAARYRLLVINSAVSQSKLEGSVLWNFVMTTIPKLETLIQQERVNAYYMAHSLDESDDDDETMVQIEKHLEEKKIDAGEEKSKSEDKDTNTKTNTDQKEEVTNPLVGHLPSTKLHEDNSTHTTSSINKRFGSRSVLKTVSNMNSALSNTKLDEDTPLRLKIIDRYEATNDLVKDRQMILNLKGGDSVHSVMEAVCDQWGYKARYQTLLLVYKSYSSTLVKKDNFSVVRLDVNKELQQYSNLVTKGVRILLLEKLHLEEMSSYQLKAWLDSKTNGRTRKQRLEQLGIKYAENLQQKQMQQAKDAMKDINMAIERKLALSSGAPIININPIADVAINKQMFAILQKEVNQQLEDVKSKTQLKELKEGYDNVLELKNEAEKILARKPTDQVGLATHSKSLNMLKRLDQRLDSKKLNDLDFVFSREVAKHVTEKMNGTFEDTLWQRKVMHGGSLRKLQKLLTQVSKAKKKKSGGLKGGLKGGGKNLKVEWCLPSEMTLFWLDRDYIFQNRQSNDIWEKRPVQSANERDDLYFLQAELVGRGEYVKYKEMLSKSPNQRLSSRTFTNSLRCIWWLDHELIEIVGTVFPFFHQHKDMNVLFDQIRARYMLWRSNHLLNGTETLWYDSGHNLLKGTNRDVNIRLQLKQLFQEAMMEVKMQWEILVVDGSSTSMNQFIGAKQLKSRSIQAKSRSSLLPSSAAPSSSLALSKEEGEVKTNKQVPRSQHSMVYQPKQSDTTEIDLFIGGADPDDIRQSGTLQDCWLLSALSILAAEENTIEHLFLRHARGSKTNRRMGEKEKEEEEDRIEPHDASYHMLRFYHAEKDVWEHIVVDDKIPKESESGKPVYGHSREPETWVMMIEKAYAKWLRSDSGYDGLNLGLVTEALVALTGGAATELNIRSPQMSAEARSGKLWRRLVELRKVGASLGCGSPSGEDSFWDVHGIVQGHAYAILDLRTVQIPDGGDGSSYRDVNMLLLRNPWGRNPWDLEPPMWYTEQITSNPDQPWPIRPLDWSPLSPRWNANGCEFVRTLLNWNPILDGATGKFWISLEDFIACYANIFVCRIPSNFKVTLRDHWSFGLQNELRSGGVLTSSTGHQNPQWCVTCLLPSSLFITLTQQSAQQNTQLKYIMVALLPNGGGGMTKPLVQKDMEEPGFYFSGKPQRQQQVSMDIDMVQPGKYTIVVCTFDSGCSINFSLSVYSTIEKSVCQLKRLYYDE
jgi:hypothetical protein